MLNQQDTARYVRQTVLAQVGQEGQRRLADSTVLLVGCGSLGSAQAMLLARAGVGRLILADRDLLELHNLHGQILYDENDVRERLPKAEAAARRLRAINSAIRIEPVIADVTAANIAELAAQADLLVDGTDNFETRYLLNDAAVQAGKPWVYGGVLGAQGMVMPVRPGQGPCLRCLFAEPPQAGTVPTCDTFGVLNTAVSWVAALQVTEVLKLLLGKTDKEFKFYTLDIWRGSVTSAAAQRREDCECCAKHSFEFLDRGRSASSTVLCGRNAVQLTPERKTVLDFALLAERLSPLGRVAVSGLLLEFTCGERRLVVFSDGRVLVMGTTDTAEARSLVARYIGS
jgi:adenylyltransferase/sulfurtransferase